MKWKRSKKKPENENISPGLEESIGLMIVLNNKVLRIAAKIEVSVWINTTLWKKYNIFL